MKFNYLTVLAIGLTSSSLSAQEALQATLAAEPSMDCEQAITVFHDISSFGRKDRAAARMTERHDEMALTGWRFADMVIYTENGDLEGFYVTYIRAAACPTGQIAQN
jgi:hypothetical protein